MHIDIDATYLQSEPAHRASYRVILTAARSPSGLDRYSRYELEDAQRALRSFAAKEGIGYATRATSPALRAIETRLDHINYFRHHLHLCKRCLRMVLGDDYGACQSCKRPLF